jgi:hypothetical protein
LANQANAPKKKRVVPRPIEPSTAMIEPKPTQEISIAEATAGETEEEKAAKV